MVKRTHEFRANLKTKKTKKLNHAQQTSHSMIQKYRIHVTNQHKIN